MLRNTFLSVNLRTKSGAKRFKCQGYWNGMNYEQASFIANPDEVAKIKDELENEFGVTFEK